MRGLYSDKPNLVNLSVAIALALTVAWGGYVVVSMLAGAV